MAVNQKPVRFQIKIKACPHCDADEVVIMASRTSHCVADLLYRWQSGDLHCDIPCVIGNHDQLRKMVEIMHRPKH